MNPIGPYLPSGRACYREAPDEVVRPADRQAPPLSDMQAGV